MPVTATQEFLETFDPNKAPHIYLDEDLVIHDRYIEAMFNTLFHGDPLDEVFQANFRTYMIVLFEVNEGDIPDEVFTDAEYVKHLVRTFFGLCNVFPYEGGEGEHFDHCLFTATTRTKYCDGGAMRVHAPTRLAAALLTIVTIMRWSSEQVFGHMVSPEQDKPNGNQAENI